MTNSFEPGRLNDLHTYDPVSRLWRDLTSTTKGTNPSPRMNHGFDTVLGKIYVYGGANSNGAYFCSELQAIKHLFFNEQEL